MRRVAAIVGATAVAAVMTVGLLAQAKPNFTGKWTRDAEKSAAANPAPPAAAAGAAAGGGGGRGGAGGGGARGGGGGAMFELKQDATSLTRVTTAQDGSTQETKYVLDGQPHDIPAGQGTAKATAKVDGATIVIETTRDNQGTPVTTKAVYSMDGEWLVIANTGAPRGDAPAMTTKSYYKKG